MELYKNLGGDSSVRGFEIGIDSITVIFTDGWKYLYTYQKAGRETVEQMKGLAVAGMGLNSFIMKHAKYAYTKKWR